MSVLSHALELALRQEQAGMSPSGTPGSSGTPAVSSAWLEHFAQVALKRGQGGQSRDAQGLVAQLRHQLAWIQSRSEGALLVRVFNPTLEEHGYTLDATVVETCMPDQPFIVDTLRMLFQSKGLAERACLHPILEVARDAHGLLMRLGNEDAEPGLSVKSHLESVIHFELSRVEDPLGLQELQADILTRLLLVRAVVRDHAALKSRALHALQDLPDGDTGRASHVQDVGEAAAFLKWLLEGHFVFMGAQRFVSSSGRDGQVAVRPGDALGLYRTEQGIWTADAFPVEALEWALGSGVIAVVKGQRESIIHRPGKIDLVLIRQVLPDGSTSGFHLLSGLFTWRGIQQSGSSIPILRARLERVLDQEEAALGSHYANSLTAAFDALPIEFLFTSSDADLTRALRRVVDAELRQEITAAIQVDGGRRASFALCSMPRRSYDEVLHDAIAQRLKDRMGASYVDSRLEHLPNRVLVTWFLTAPDGFKTFMIPELEAEVLALARPWEDRFAQLLRADASGEGERLCALYLNAFPEAYVLEISPEEAQRDVTALERLRQGSGLEVRVVPDTQASSGGCLLKFYQKEQRFLSDSLPVLQNFGLKVANQSSYHLVASEGSFYLDVFRIRGVEGQQTLDILSAGDALAQAVHSVMERQADNDVLNRLVLLAGMSWRQVVVLRAYLALGRQLENIPQDFLRRVWLNHPDAARAVLELFDARLTPQLGVADSAERLALVGRKRTALEERLRQVESSAEDRVLRLVLRLVEATVRTNYYRTPEREFVSVKLDSEKALPAMTGLRPFREIFVYHVAVEGIHLRGGPVARGGLRWSDRYDDYRSEILDLMRTQMVKNVIIVPVGAKGGFILKQVARSRDEERRLADERYKTFIRGLLDVTDNIVGGNTVHPSEVVIHDGPDPYLVVAADKGTAHLSDTANAISAEYGFWLGDAFASGGSQGYDHKKEAITAKGGWECVKRHFWELGRDPEVDPITVVGIGDMSGDVFGNGMLLSRSMKLLGAFNHQHIFLDPDPDPARSFAERLRLFQLPRSSWEDYDLETVSQGGGIFRRSAKSIPLSPEVQRMLGTHVSSLPGEAVVRLLLALEVELLWNGGIGTYFKASTETHADVGDRVNDAVRIDATELKAKVVGEGGNLGFTQRGRIEYALRGGRINTDALDNSGGVDMSDHEVNLKILLQPLVASGRLSMDARNTLLARLTAHVAGSVLSHNFSQSVLLSLDALRCEDDWRPFAALIEDLLGELGLDPQTERLPDARTLEARFKTGKGLTRPELARLSALTKMRLRRWLKADARLAGPFVERLLLETFPPEIRERFAPDVLAHPLRSDIVAATLTGKISDLAGITFFQELQDDTGRSPGEIAMAWMVSHAVLEVESLKQAVLDPAAHIPAMTQYRVLLDLASALQVHCRRTLLRGYDVFDTDAVIARLKTDLQTLVERLEEVLPERAARLFQEDMAEYAALEVPSHLVRRIASLAYLASASDIAILTERTSQPLGTVAWLYHALGETSRLRAAYELAHPEQVVDRLSMSALSLLRGRLLERQFKLALQLGGSLQGGRTAQEALDAFLELNADVIRRVRDVEKRLSPDPAHKVATVTVLSSMLSELRV